MSFKGSKVDKLSSAKYFINPFQRLAGRNGSSFDHKISFTQGLSLSSAKMRSGLGSLIGSNHFVIKYRRPNG
ncbi:hypothetical protein, partial [Planktomarina temperata]|uniref:hypothetical protein n=1 Tax=Planktomarina temperata TaxID=1284658 RepID=UPI003C75ED6C